MGDETLLVIMLICDADRRVISQEIASSAEEYSATNFIELYDQWGRS